MKTNYQLLYLHDLKTKNLNRKLNNLTMNLKPLLTTKVVAVLCFFIISTTVFAQKESVIYIGTNGKLTTLDHAIYMQKVNNKSARVSLIQTYTLNDANWEKTSSEQFKKLNDSTYQIKARGKNFKGTILRIFVRQADKSFKFKDVVNSNIIKTGFAKSVMPLLFDGQVFEFYPGGNKKSIAKYKDNELVSNENWSENGDKYIDNIFYSVDKDPTFSPGKKVLQDQILKAYKDAGIDISVINGSMIIGFVVMEDGTIDGIKLIKGLGPTINSVTLESFSNLKGTWTPAKLNNHTVRYFQVFPINFINKETHFNYAEIGKGNFNFGF